MVFDLGVTAIIEQECYFAYTEDGIGAAIRTKADIQATFNNENTVSGFPAGSIHIVIDFKLRNPLYDPPDILRGGFIPGFTWFIAIPALIGIAAVGLINRKRK